jgi:hypothetical protein
MIDDAKKVDDGGDAFPSMPHKVEYGVVYSANGMRLRDYFAAMALQVITKNISLDDFVRLKPQELAEGAFKIADAMVERRKNGRE